MGIPTLAWVLAGFAFAATSSSPVGAFIDAPGQPEDAFCGTGEPPQVLVRLHRLHHQLNLNDQQGNQSRSLQFRAAPRENEGKYDDDDYNILETLEGQLMEWSPVTVPVYHHHLYSERVSPLLTSDNLRKQMQILNDAFKPTGFQFELKAATYRKVPEWATNATARDESGGMHEQLREGDYGTLNVYWFEEGRGFASYPTPAGSAGLQPDRYFDAVELPCVSIVGGPVPGWNSGKALVHYVGHWLGLKHTYSESCLDQGDLIRDTPAALFSVGGCNTTLDTCPDQPGLDPVHNYMAHSDEGCMTEFTQGQIQRMQLVWLALRASRLSTALVRLLFASYATHMD